MLASFLGETGNVFFPKLDFYHDQIYFKEIALSYLEEKSFEPLFVQSEKEAKEFDFRLNPSKYPIYFLKQTHRGEKTFEEFYTDKENYNIDKYDSLGFINSPSILISFDEVIADFDLVFNNPDSKKNDIIQVIKKYVPDFNHLETGKTLDQKI